MSEAVHRNFRKQKSLSLGKLAWKRFFSDRLALLGIFVIVTAGIIALFGSAIRPDRSPNANNQQLSIAQASPGYSQQFLRLPARQASEQEGEESGLFFGQQANYTDLAIVDYHFEGNHIVVAPQNEVHPNPLKVDLLEVVYGSELPNFHSIWEGDSAYIGVPGATPTVFSRSELQDKVLSTNIITKKFWLGTDRFGRDLLSRLMAGTKVSLSVGFIAVLISLLIGVSLGALAGYFGGWVDQTIQWLINVVWSIPTLLMVVAITVMMGKGFAQVFLAVGLTMWVEVARVVRGQVKSLREREFVEAGTALGYSNFRIISKHILPNLWGPVIVISAANFATAILLEAGLSFLGVGAQPPMASWGGIIKNHYHFITTNKAHLAIFPGLCISILVLSFMLVGEGLRGALDEKQTAH